MFQEKHLIVTMLHEKATLFMTYLCIKSKMFHVKHSAKHVGCMEFNLAQAKPLQPLELFSYKCLRSLNATFTPHSSGCCLV